MKVKLANSNETKAVMAGLKHAQLLEPHAWVIIIWPENRPEGGRFANDKRG